MEDRSEYGDWTREALIKRIKHLEDRLRSQSAAAPTQRPVADAPTLNPVADAPTRNSVADAPTRTPAADSSALNSRQKKSLEREAKSKRRLDTSKWSSRYIALKLAYLGKNYGGFEHQQHAEKPSIELELWKALTTARLITPEDVDVVDFGCCEYSKCGRTDRGVSSFGQVIGLRVRSKRPSADVGAAKKLRLREREGESADEKDGKEAAATEADRLEPAPTPTFDPVRDEFPYCRMLNRLLPDDIRVLAWCPAPPEGFSARFSCRERQYRYFFTQPAFSPLPATLAAAGNRGGDAGEGWLDVDAMRDAARRFEGEQDFRNFCRVDPAKQIRNFTRTVFGSRIEEVADVRPVLPYLNGAQFAAAAAAKDDGAVDFFPKVYSFNVNGSAFLWHQIRHMVAVLFLVGQGLEEPSIVSTMLDMERLPQRPVYTMADEVPLVLWDCIFPDIGSSSSSSGPAARTDTLDWVYVGDDEPRAKFGIHGLVDVMWQGWRTKMMDELLSARLMDLVSRQGRDVAACAEASRDADMKLGGKTRLFDGGNTWRSGGSYVPLLRRDRQEPPEAMNERYAKRCGFASAEEYRKAKGIR